MNLGFGLKMHKPLQFYGTTSSVEINPRKIINSPNETEHYLNNIDEFVIIKDVDWDSTIYLPKGQVGVEITIINLSEKPVMLSTINEDLFYQNDCPQIELPGNGFSLRFFYYDNNSWVNII